MADLTRAEMIDRVLEHLGIKAPDQSVDATDAARVGEAVDAAHERLRKLGIALFPTSAIPPWAQVPFRDYIAGDIGRTYGFGDSLKPAQAAAEHELARQVAGYRHPVRVKANYF